MRVLNKSWLLVRCRETSHRLYWERGRPARSERKARKDFGKSAAKTFAPATRCGRDARAPSIELPLIIKLP